MNTLELRDITYNDVLNNISIKIKKGSNISIIGSSDCGKTCLNNILKYKLKFKGSYLINGVEISNTNKYLVDRYVNNVENKYDNKKIIDILFDAYEDLEEEKKELEINKVLKYFTLNKYAKYKINDLTLEYKYYFLIIMELLKKDTYLVIDDYCVS